MRNQKAVALPEGYAYTPGRNHRDMFGRAHRWRVVPVPVPGAPYYGGSVAYFDRCEDVQRWAYQVQQVRDWQAEFAAAEAAREV
jgi:hypothetical protein